MKVFPVVERELRAASRRPGTFWVRFIAAGVAMIILGWILLVNRESSHTADLGQTIFFSLSVFALVYCLFAGVRNTADCISEERREGTLGLLFLTDLKAFEVLFGKLAATSLNSFYGLVAVFPVLAVPLLLGGITYEQYGIALLALLNALFFSLAVGICISTFVQGERAAMMWTIAIITFFAFGWRFLGWLVLEQMLGMGHFFDRVTTEMFYWWISPGFSLFELLDSLEKVGISDSVWASLGIVHLLAWLFIFLAQLKLPYIWQDKVTTVQGLRWRQRWKLWCHGDSGQRLRYRQKLLDESPTFWLGSRNRLKPMMVWVVLAVFGALWLWGYAVNQNGWLDDAVFVMTVLTLNTVLKFWLAVEAAHCFNRDRQSGALELMLSTPLEVSEIIRGQFQALKRQFFGPVVVVLLLHFLFMISQTSSGSLVTWYLGNMAMLVADLFAIAYVGMWLGLKSRYATRASGMVLARLILLPWLLIFGFFTFIAVAGRLFGSSGSFELFFSIWLLAGLGLDLFFGMRAWTGLHEKLRDLAASRFDGSSGMTKG
jgi:ABC-type transport system involved in cytochrome c biogenesis permease component